MKERKKKSLQANAKTIKKTTDTLRIPNVFHTLNPTIQYPRVHSFPSSCPLICFGHHPFLFADHERLMLPTHDAKVM